MSVSEYDSSKENQNPMLISYQVDEQQKRKKDLMLRDDATIDLEIEQIEMEMSRLLSRLESLKLEKVRISERRGSVVATKYTKEKQSTNTKLGFLQKMQDSKAQRRGASLCPSEIYSGAKQSSRRQSCFWKVGEIDELKVTKKAVTTIGSTKALKKDDAVLSSVQPKKLFREVASRYSQSLDGVGKVRALCDDKVRVKKRWEIPAKGEVVVYKSNRESKPAIDEIADVLPKVRTVRCVKTLWGGEEGGRFGRQNV